MSKSLVLKLLYFQLLWFVVLAYDHPLLYLLSIVSIGLDYHFFQYKINKINYLYFLCFICFVGLCLDFTYYHLEIMQWDKDVFYPQSLNQIWMIFVVYYPSVFKKFEGKLILAFVFAAIFAPLAYISGAKISSLSFALKSWFDILCFSLSWGSFFVLSLLSFDFLEKKSSLSSKK